MGSVPGGVCDLPRPGIKPMSAALAGRFLTMGPLKNSSHFLVGCVCVCVVTDLYELFVYFGH